MKRKFIFILFILCLSLISFSKWIKTTGKITDVEMVDEGSYGYYLTYEIDKKFAYYNIGGEFIEGPMSPAIFSEIKPIEGQEVDLYYDSEEPMFFEIVENE